MWTCIFNCFLKCIFSPAGACAKKRDYTVNPFGHKKPLFASSLAIYGGIKCA